MVSIITTCKGRLDHLKECLPTWLNQGTYKDFEIVVVDYACPENTADYIESLQDSRVRAVRATDCGHYFNLSRARNIGILESVGDVLFILDCDTKLSPDFLKYHVGKVLVDGSFVTGWLYGDATGSCLVHRRDCMELRGYNENVEGWGWDDIDFYKRLEYRGIEQRGFHHGIETIKHDDTERVKHYNNGNMKQTDQQNQKRTKRKFVSCIL
jgi:glycosyltransferase involved in cell wall biosynthesis